ncbi:MAG: hypothetical protein AAGG48_14740 [Planctomycetota bacterium]
MKERPILLYQHEVPGIIDGQRTQLRRVVKHQPPTSEDWRPWFCAASTERSHMNKWHWAIKDPTEGGGFHKMDEVYFASPCGLSGDRLWGRETWADVNSEDGPSIMYRTDLSVRSWLEFSKSFGPDFGAGPSMDYESYPGDYVMWHDDLAAYDMGHHKEDGYRWRPSIHMPRWASRITLEVTDVRVERLNDISEEDAKAEGLESEIQYLDAMNGSVCFRGSPDLNWNPCPEASFRELWESINGKGSFDSRWVWAVTFKPITNGGEK